MNVLTVLIDNEEYFVVTKIEVENNEYYYLISVTDNEKFLIRKVEKKNNKVYLQGLKDEKEFNMVLNQYRKNITLKGEKNDR